MRTIRIYQPGHYKNGDIVSLSPGASLHVATVLRMHAGEQLILFCGDNREFPATITAIHKKKVSVTIDAVLHVNRESPRAIHLAQAISKGERMEFIIQKAVELGIASITPLITARCVVRLDAERLAKKQSQWEAIAIGACEQSGRNQLPIIHSPIPMPLYLKECQASTKLILHPHDTKTWRELVFKEGDIALSIGPEGGFDEIEINSAHAARFESLCLGPRVLRTETAAIAAISIIQAIGGDI